MNGIDPLLQKPLNFDGSAKHPLGKFLKRHQWPPQLCLSEGEDILEKTLPRKRRSTSPHEPEHRALFSLLRAKYNATGFGEKVHGVATLVRRDMMAHRVDAIPYDGTGRSAEHAVKTAVPWGLEGRVLVTLIPDYTTSQILVVINGHWINGTAIYTEMLSLGKSAGPVMVIS